MGNKAPRLARTGLTARVVIVHGLTVLLAILVSSVTIQQPAVALRAPVFRVDAHGGSVQASFDFHGPVHAHSFYVPAPDRLVIDVSGAVLMRDAGSTYETGTANVRRVRISQFSYAPDVVRIVFDLNKATQLNLDARDDLGMIHVSESVAGQIHEHKPREATGLDPEAWKTLRFPDITVRQSEDYSEILIPFGQMPAFSSDRLDNPSRTFFDFSGYTPGSMDQFIPVNTPALYDVRIGYFSRDPDVTRLVLDHAPGAHVETAYSGGGMLLRVYAPGGGQEEYPGVEHVSLRGRVICVDPGHGGHDPGAVAPDGTREKDINLSIALSLKELLVQSGARVIMTRDRDYFVTLEDRAGLANRAGADLFISIHNNAVGDSTRRTLARGTQTYYYQSPDLGAVLQKELTGMLRIGDSGTFSRNFAVLRRTEMPSVLIEAGFLTHPDDLVLLQNQTFRDNAARGIFNGVARYFNTPGRLAALPLSAAAMAHLPGGGSRTPRAVADAGSSLRSGDFPSILEASHYEDQTTLDELAELAADFQAAKTKVDRLKRIIAKN